MVDVNRLFSVLNILPDKLGEQRNAYIQQMQLHPPPWTTMQKVPFKASIKDLQRGIDKWNECIETLLEKASRTRNEGDRAALYFRVDTIEREHENLTANVRRIIDEANEYFTIDLPPENTIPPRNTTSGATGTVPPINLPKFDGDYLKWTPFWQRFEHAVHSKPYPKVEKLISLLGYLEGRALEEVEGFTVSDENYDTIVQTLSDRFGRKHLIIKELQMKLRGIEPAKANPESLRSTVNMICNMCRQLQNLGVDIDNDSMKMDILEKLPHREKEKLNWLLISKPEEATIDKIIDRMKEMTLRAETAPKEKLFVSPERSNISQSNIVKQDRKMLQPTDTVGKNKCSLCDGDHWAMKCQKFDSPDKKIQQLRARNYCIKCSSKYHDTQSCNSNVECDICKGNHYSYLCTTRNIRSTAFVTVGKKQGMLLTKEVLICNPVTKETADTVVIFDTGSQQSYISDKLIRQLKLETLQEEQLNVTGFGAMTSDYISSLVKLQIKTTDGHMDIYANSAKRIATTVPVVLSELFELHDIKTVYKSADILIGMDYFFKFVTSFKNYDDNLHIVHSKVGEMICKNVPQNYKTTVSSMAIKSSQPLHKAEHDVQQNHESSMKKVVEQKALNVNEKQKTDKVLCPKFDSNIHRTLKVKTGADFTSTIQQSQIQNVYGDVQMPGKNDILSNRGSAIQKVLQRQNKFVRPPSSLTTGTDVNYNSIQQHEKSLPQKFKYLSPQQQSDYLALRGKNTTVRGGEGLAENPMKFAMKTMNDKNLVLSDTDEPQKEHTTKFGKNENNNDLDKGVFGEKDSDDPASHTYLISLDY